MKFLLIILIFASINSCKAKQALSLEEKEIISTSQCPADGTCSSELIHNKSIKTLFDNFGAMYIETIDGNSLVFNFEYKRNDIPNTMDGHYIEKIFMELDPNNLNLELSNSELKKVNLIFARFCYCKGQTGYYQVRKGNLIIKKEEDNNYHLHLTFKVDEVPQIITEINQVLNIE